MIKIDFQQWALFLLGWYDRGGLIYAKIHYDFSFGDAHAGIYGFAG